MSIVSSVSFVPRLYMYIGDPIYMYKVEPIYMYKVTSTNRWAHLLVDGEHAV